MANKDTTEFMQFLLGLSFPTLACTLKQQLKILMDKISYDEVV